MSGGLIPQKADKSGFFAMLGDDVQEAVLALLRRQCALYTGGDSTSVRVETARELFAGIEFTLVEYLASQGLALDSLARGDLSERLAVGRVIIEKKTAACRELWQRACLGAPAFASASLTETLHGIGGFWSSYDTRFFPHRIPCDIDYQLCVPVSEDCEGVNYIAAYLRRLCAENDLLSRVDAHFAAALLEEVIHEYKESVANLYEPILANAAGLALISEDLARLSVSGAQRERIAQRLRSLGVAAPDALGDAARAACLNFCANGDFSPEYAVLAARSLWPRVALALERGGLEGVFVSF